MEKPGKCTKGITHIDERLFYWTARFIKTNGGRVADMGCLNVKSKYIKNYYSVYIDIEQIDSEDFNFWTVPQGYINAFDIVLCFEVLEHLQNPLLFMYNIKKMLKRSGKIYLSTPARPRFLWTEHHFFEMNKKHLTKWILNPLGLKIVRSKRIRINHPWYFYLSGIRPLFRIFFNYTRIYEIYEKTKAI